jgi:ArsR family transcriptional regulator
MIPQVLTFIDAQTLTEGSTTVNIDRSQCPSHTDPVTTLLPIAAETGACCAPLVRAPLGADDAATLATQLKALADPARLRLLSLIAAHDGGEACVCDLIEPLGLSQPTVSHHLKVLVDAGLLTREKRGVWAYFTLVPQALDSIARVLTTV